MECQEKRKAQGVKRSCKRSLYLFLKLPSQSDHSTKRMVIFCIQEETKKAVFFFQDHVYPEQNTKGA